MKYRVIVKEPGDGNKTIYFDREAEAANSHYALIVALAEDVREAETKLRENALRDAKKLLAETEAK